MKKILIIHFAFFIVFGLNAQSLDSLVILALNQNQELNILKKEYKMSLEKVEQVGQMPDPELGLGLFPLPVETRLGSQLMRLSAMQKIPWFGLLESQQNLENTKAKIVLAKAAARALLIQYEVKKAYYSLYELRKEQRIIQENLVLYEALESLALTNVESSKGSATDVLKIQMKRQELEQELELKKEDETEFLVTINQLLNQSLDTKINTETELDFVELPLDKTQLLAEISSQHPMIKVFEVQQEIANKKLEVNNLSSKPSFGVGLDYMLVNDRKDAFPENNGRDILQVRGTIRIPINKRKYEAKEREEKLQIEILEDRKADIISRFSSEIEKAYSKHRRAKIQIELYEKQKEIIRSTIKISESNYSASGNNFEELLLLKQSLFEYDLKILRSVVSSWKALNEVERMGVLND